MQASTFLVDEQSLRNSPSRRDGVSFDVETNNRIYACELLTQAGLVLELPTQVVCSSQLLLHRFFCRRSMVEFHVEEIAQTAVFIATKIEECPRKVRDILTVFHWLLQRRAGETVPQPLLTTTENFNDRVRRLRNMELIMLNELGYVLFMDHPHRFLLSFMHLLQGDRKLSQRAWSYINDSMRTTACILFRPEAIAAAAVSLAARALGAALPDSPPWWTVLDVADQDIEKVSCMISDLYRRDKIQFIPVISGSAATPVPTSTDSSSSAVASDACTAPSAASEIARP